MTHDEFLRTLTRLADAFPGAPMAEGTVSIWWEFFGDRDADVFDEAATEWIANEERFPNVAKFKSYVGRVARMRRQAAIVDEIEATAPRDRTGEHNIEAVRHVLEAALRRDDLEHPDDAAATEALVGARPVLTVGPPLPRTRGHGCVEGFTEAADGSGAVVPCQTCNYPAYRRWAEGEYRPTRIITR